VEQKGVVVIHKFNVYASRKLACVIRALAMTLQLDVKPFVVLPIEKTDHLGLVNLGFFCYSWFLGWQETDTIRIYDVIKELSIDNV
jgi:hypothetical protein